MERFRLKNIIILILVLLNGFLVSSLAQRRTAERDAFHRTAEQLAALFEENGMTLEPGAVSRDLPSDGVALARDTALEERAAAFLLGDALSVSDQGGGIFHYAGPAGEAFFRSSGGFEAAGTLAQRDVEDFCRDFCRTFSYEAPDLRLDEEGSGVFTALAEYVLEGGGVVFGPRPCDYSKKVNKSTRRLALRRVLGDLIAASKVSTVSEFSVADGKTKYFIKAVKDLTDAKKVLIVAASFDETTYRAARNVQEVLLMTAAEVNIEQLMNADAVILVDNALETLASRTA